MDTEHNFTLEDLETPNVLLTAYAKNAPPSIFGLLVARYQTLYGTECDVGQCWSKDVTEAKDVPGFLEYTKSFGFEPPQASGNDITLCSNL